MPVQIRNVGWNAWTPMDSNGLQSPLAAWQPMATAKLRKGSHFLTFVYYVYILCFVESYSFKLQLFPSWTTCWKCVWHRLHQFLMCLLTCVYVFFCSQVILRMLVICLRPGNFWMRFVASPNDKRPALTCWVVDGSCLEGGNNSNSKSNKTKNNWSSWRAITLEWSWIEPKWWGCLHFPTF